MKDVFIRQWLFFEVELARVGSALMHPPISEDAPPPHCSTQLALLL